MRQPRRAIPARRDVAARPLASHSVSGAVARRVTTDLLPSANAGYDWLASNPPDAGVTRFVPTAGADRVSPRAYSRLIPPPR